MFVPGRSKDARRHRGLESSFCACSYLYCRSSNHLLPFVLGTLAVPFIGGLFLRVSEFVQIHLDCLCSDTSSQHTPPLCVGSKGTVLFRWLTTWAVCLAQGRQ